MAKQYYELALVHNVTMKKRGKSECIISKLNNCINTEASVNLEENMAFTVRPLEVLEDSKNKLNFKNCVNHGNSEIVKRQVYTVVPSLAYADRNRINPLYGISVVFDDIENLYIAKKLMKDRLEFVACNYENKREEVEIGLQLLDKLEIR